MSRILTYILFINAILYAFIAHGQENVGHTDHNPFLKAKSTGPKHAAKTTATTTNLPFFEDFTGYGVYPDSTRWTDYKVYINNTMCVSPVSRGVATFDGLDEHGTPYDSFSNINFRYCDSLTSQPINLDLQSVTPGDNVYLSFFYQPQGNGFFPLGQDSLMLYFKTKYSGYQKVWTAFGTHLQPFTQVMIPITDSLYFDSFFQFRFVNIAAMYWADADWNLDYIILDKNRSQGDTVVNDIGFTSAPSFYLNDYTYMPYRQFMANPASERATGFTDSVRNNFNSTQTISYGYSATALNTGAILQPASATLASVFASRTTELAFTNYTATIPMPGIYDKVVFENKFFIGSTSSTGSLGNDTIVREQVFDNYLAYDDGTAEKSYYLNLLPTLPGKVAIEFHLNQPDTMRGMAIYFGRQVPFAGYKNFSINVYSALAGVNGSPADVALYTQDLYSAGYADTVNHFWIYTFDTPVPLPAGTFFAGTTQPASGNSDSLYFGLDVNRVGSNHAYYKVLTNWNISGISGAIMMRPLLGQVVIPTAIEDVQAVKNTWQVTPNPATDHLQFEFKGDRGAVYHITDISGHSLLQGKTQEGGLVDISVLTPGMYFVSLNIGGVTGIPQKFIKL